jgi:hypothetical protein
LGYSAALLILITLSPAVGLTCVLSGCIIFDESACGANFPFTGSSRVALQAKRYRKPTYGGLPRLYTCSDKRPFKRFHSHRLAQLINYFLKGTFRDHIKE